MRLLLPRGEPASAPITKMPGTVDSKVGDNLGKASRSGPVNSIPIDSTKPRGATDPSRATITSHAILSSPLGVSSVSQPGPTLDRTTVLSGKGVSVSVHLGGPRFLKKK